VVKSGERQRLAPPNPIERRMTPHSQNEILNRINEITFNSSLMAEARAINFVTRLIRPTHRAESSARS